MNRKETEDFYRTLLKPENSEYDQLSSGKESTDKRHVTALELVDTEGSIVLDVGCGTGLLLEKIKDYNIKYYYGIDIFMERKPYVMDRLEKSGINGQFICLPTDYDLIEFLKYFQLVLTEKTSLFCIQMLGTGEFYSPRKIFSFLTQVRKMSHTGIVIFARKYKDSTEEPHLKRIPDRTIKKWVENLDVKYDRIHEWEHTIFWEEN